MKKIISVILFSVIIFSCKEDENFHDEQLIVPLSSYMATDNDLYAAASADMEATVNAVRQEMQQLMEGMETADVPAPERRTYVEPIYKTQSGQENLSEQRTPKERLPP
jgi:hypothetical protein